VSDVRLVLRPEARVGAFVARPFAPFVVVSLARVDARSDVRYLTADDLRGEGSSVDEAFARASSRARVVAPAGTVVRAPCASGLLALPGWLASFRAGGRPVASIPDRDVVVVSLDARPEGVARFADDARRAFHDASRPLSPALYTLDDDGAVAPFTDGAPLGHALLASTAYAEQKTRLDSTSRRGGALVAEHVLVEHRDDGRPVTLATWGEQTSTLLPRVDVVVLAGASWRFAVRWSVLEARVAASCWTLRDDLRPGRILTTAWPSEAELRALFEVRDPLLEGALPGR
jgi:hypothetical protein